MLTCSFTLDGLGFETATQMDKFYIFTQTDIFIYLENRSFHDALYLPHLTYALCARSVFSRHCL